MLSLRLSGRKGDDAMLKWTQ